MKSMTVVILLVEFDTYSLELEYVNWSHNERFVTQGLDR